MPVPPEIRKKLHGGIGALLEQNNDNSECNSAALCIWNKNIESITTKTLKDLYDAISTEGNPCREFGVLDIESCIPGAEMYYDAEYLARNTEPVRNHMATDLFGQLQDAAIFGAVVIRRKEHGQSAQFRY